MHPVAVVGTGGSRRAWRWLGLGLGAAGKEASVERQPPAILVEDGPVEPFDDGAVVG